MQSTVLIVGGAGFIGFHCSRRALLEGRRVVMVDNLSRAGARANLAARKNLAEEKIGSFLCTRTPRQGVHRLIDWVRANRGLVSSTLGF
jgi:CDP-paratose 2-epimerase